MNPKKRIITNELLPNAQNPTNKTSTNAKPKPPSSKLSNQDGMISNQDGIRAVIAPPRYKQTCSRKWMFCCYIFE